MIRKKAFSEATVSTVRRLVPIDAAMFQKMCEDVATCQEIISTILDEPVKESVVPQNTIANLQGRDVRLDCLFELSNGTYVNVEFQKPDNDDHEEKAWYDRGTRHLAQGCAVCIRLTYHYCNEVWKWHKRNLSLSAEF